MESRLSQIIRRALNDPVFRAQLKSDPAAVLAGTGLTAEELAAAASLDPRRLTALGVDQRMSKAFADFGLGIRWTSIDPDMTHLGPTGKSFVDEGGWDGRTALNSAVLGAAIPPVMSSGGMSADGISFDAGHVSGPELAGDVIENSVEPEAQQPAADVYLTEH